MGPMSGRWSFLRWQGGFAIVVLLLALPLQGAAAPTKRDSVTVTITPTSSTTLTIGASLLVTMTNTNVTSEAITLADNFFLIEPDGTRLALPINATISMGANSSRDVVAQSIGTSVFTQQTGRSPCRSRPPTGVARCWEGRHCPSRSARCLQE
jgi:hypothetical protein